MRDASIIAAAYIICHRFSLHRDEFNALNGEQHPHSSELMRHGAVPGTHDFESAMWKVRAAGRLVAYVADAIERDCIEQRPPIRVESGETVTVEGVTVTNDRDGPIIATFKEAE